MITKLFEIRDKHTFIPVIATKLGHESEAQSYLLRVAGFFQPLNPSAIYILLARLSGRGEFYASPHDWSGRTMVTAHKHIIANWETLEDGDVIDVEFILGETKVKKVSERELLTIW